MILLDNIISHVIMFLIENNKIVRRGVNREPKSGKHTSIHIPALISMNYEEE